jgi:hypothetical protein
MKTIILNISVSIAKPRTGGETYKNGVDGSW